MSIFPLLALGGGAAAVGISKGELPSQTPVGSMDGAVTARPTLGNGMNPGLTVAQINQLNAPAPGVTAPKTYHLASFKNIMGSVNGGILASGVSKPNVSTSDLFGVQQGYKNPASNDLSADLKEKLDAVDAYAQQAYQRLDDSARYEGAKAANAALDLNPPLTGNESYETMASVVGAAAGGAAGAYIGGPLGAKIGAIVGAYLGVQLEEFLSKDLDQIGDWFKSKWSDIESWTEDEASSIGDDVTSFLGSIF